MRLNWTKWIAYWRVLYGPPYQWASVLWATLSSRKKIEDEEKNRGRGKTIEREKKLTSLDFLSEAKNFTNFLPVGKGGAVSLARAEHADTAAHWVRMLGVFRALSRNDLWFQRWWISSRNEQNDVYTFSDWYWCDPIGKFNGVCSYGKVLKGK